MRQEDLAPRSVAGRAVAPRDGFDALIRASHERSHGFGSARATRPTSQVQYQRYLLPPSSKTGPCYRTLSR